MAVIEWIVTSSILIAVIIALRCLLKGKISLRLQYALWGLVLLRLLIPFSIGSSGFSVMNTVQKVPVVQDAESMSSVDQIEHMTDGSVEGYYPSDFMCDFPTVVAENKTAEEYARMEKVLSFREAFIRIWRCGTAVLFIAFAASNGQFSSRLRRTRKPLEVKGSALPVYISNETDTPCLFGLFRPAIYLTQDAAEDAAILRHTVEHETTHFRHGDNFWSALRVVCLALHWYNPLVWWAAFLSRNDAELACDEATINRIGESERAEYGRALIGITCQKRTALLITATTMTESKSSIRERIMLLAKKPNMAVYTLVAVVVVAAIAVGCTFTGAEQPTEQVDIFSDGPITISVSQEYVDQLYVDSLYSDDMVTRIANIYYKPDYATSNEYTAQGCGGWIMSVISCPDDPMGDMSHMESGIGTEYKARATDGKRVYMEEYPMDGEYHDREHPENAQIYNKILESLQIDYGDLDSYVAPSAAAAADAIMKIHP